MSKEEVPEIEDINSLERSNPNNIGELLSIGKDLPTSADKVYRSVKDKAAVDDIEVSGIVRNKQTAELVEKSRWGEKVFWSRGADGKFHVVTKDGYVIEAPFAVASERVVRRDDISAIYTKNELNEVVNILDQKEQEKKRELQESRDRIQSEDKDKIDDIRKKLGLD